MMAPDTPAEPGAPSIDLAKASAPHGQGAAQQEIDPLVDVWHKRIAAAKKRWDKQFRRMRHNRKLLKGIDENVDPTSPLWNKHRANLIQSSLTVVLSKVYAKNPEMSGAPTNKSADLRLFADTLSAVTQTMLEDAKLKKKAKAAVRAAMTCSYGVLKVQYQRDLREDPIIRSRINDAQDNIQRIESLIAACEDEQARGDHEAKKRELEEMVAGLEAQKEVVAAEGLAIDRVPSDRLVVDDAVEDVWEYETAGWMAEALPMRKSAAKALFPDFDLDSATRYNPEGDGRDAGGKKAPVFSGGATGSASDDPIILVWEVWSQQDQRIFTLVDGCNKQFARAPYSPTTGERWYPYFILPFQSVDGEFAAQSLVDVLERLQEEHNETRDKFAEVRKLNVPHWTASADIKDKDIQKKQVAGLGEVVTINTGGEPLGNVIQQSTQLQIDPAMYDTAPIRNDWEQVSGLSDAARSVVVQPKTATEAAISDQSLAARVAEFRDQVEDWLTEIAQYSSELCLLSMTPAQVESIMGAPAPADPQEAAAALLTGQAPPEPKPTYEWPSDRTPESVFNLVQIKIRAGSTSAPNKLEMQDNWNKALQLLMPMIDKIRQVDAMGGDSTPERELVKETAARFDETIDVERYLPPKPARPAPNPLATAGAQMSGPMPGMPMQGGAPLSSSTPLQ